MSHQTTEYGISVNGRDPDPEDTFTTLEECQAGLGNPARESIVTRVITAWKPVR